MARSAQDHPFDKHQGCCHTEDDVPSRESMGWTMIARPPPMLMMPEVVISFVVAKYAGMKALEARYFPSRTTGHACVVH